MFPISESGSTSTAMVEMENAVARVKEAQLQFSTFSQEQVDHIVKSIAEAAFKQSEYLAKLAVEETGMGVVEHKKIKNELGSMGVYESIRDEKTVGVIQKNHALKITEIAYPFGVIAAICPTTNPTSTAIFKTIIALKAQNGIVVSPHPSAAKCTVEALKICNEAAVQAGAPQGLIGWITNPIMEATTALMKHKNVDLLLATGGKGLVKVAYSSEKPAYGVGPGNGPAFIEKSANVKKAVQMIVDSKTFDNGTLCSTEQSIVVHKNIKAIVLREFQNNGSYILNPTEKALLGKLIAPTPGHLNAAIVGRSAEKIANMAGIDVPLGTRVLIAEEDQIGEDVPFSLEKLAPIFPLYTADSNEQAHQICKDLLNFVGRGHSCSIHTTDDEAVQKYGLEMPVSRVLVNTLASIGAAGGTTGLMPSLTLGCGSYGGNISSDNITARHLFNIKRVAFGIKEVSIPKPSPRNSNYVKEQVNKDYAQNINDIVDQVLKQVHSNKLSMDPNDLSQTIQNVIKEYKN